jgi:hypothetical protein
VTAQLLAAMPVAFELTWDPFMRGFLSVAVGVVVLLGSVYLLLGTNVGSRLGFLIAFAGLFGWMTIMGLQWWVYGIGLAGDGPSWHATEIITSESEDDTDGALLPEARELETWDEVPEGDTRRGEIQAAAEEALTDADSSAAPFTATNEFQVLDVFETGGKEGIARRLPGPHPPHHAAVQVQRVIPVVTLANPEDECPPDSTCIEFGETPPSPELDESAPIRTVVMERDLGNLRFPPALITIASAVLFGVSCNALHRRDKASAAARAGASRSS